MSDELIFVGDTPTFRATIKDDDTAVDISAATATKNFLIEPPNGIAITVATAFFTDGTDGIIQYTPDSTILNVAGNWRLQGNIVLVGGWAGHTSIYKFKVNDTLT